MKDSPTGSDAVEHARALRVEYIRQQIAFIDVEFTTSLTFLARAATERHAGDLDRVAATAHQAQTAYDEAVKHLGAAGLSDMEQKPIEVRRREVANLLAQFSTHEEPARARALDLFPTRP